MAESHGRRQGLLARLKEVFSSPSMLRSMTVDMNDGVVATAGLLEGFSQAGATQSTLLTAAIIATLAGGMSLGGNRYAELAAERDAQLRVVREEALELAEDPEEELAELTSFYVRKGLSPGLAAQVARQLMEHDPLAAQMETEHHLPNVVTRSGALTQGADAALAFLVGSFLPLLISAFIPGRFDWAVTLIVVAASLALTSVLLARANHSPVWRTVLRTVSVGLFSLLVSFLAGSLLV